MFNFILSLEEEELNSVVENTGFEKEVVEAVLRGVSYEIFKKMISCEDLDLGLISFKSHSRNNPDGSISSFSKVSIDQFAKKAFSGIVNPDTSIIGKNSKYDLDLGSVNFDNFDSIVGNWGSKSYSLYNLKNINSKKKSSKKTSK